MPVSPQKAGLTWCHSSLTRETGQGRKAAAEVGRDRPGAPLPAVCYGDGP